MIRITETARDAMQGLSNFIPTELKISYVNALLQVGFDIVDCGSFVSEKVIPQMADTPQVLQSIQQAKDGTGLMALVVNTKGVQKALQFNELSYLSYPFSVSPTFLKRNLNANVKDALGQLREMMQLTDSHSIEWVVYLSMALGNPYGDRWSVKMVVDTAEKLYRLGIRNMPLSDILGQASPDTIYEVYHAIIPAFPDVDFGLHLHTLKADSYRKLEAAYEAGVRSFETVINGLGGCPTASDNMVGNLSTQELIAFCEHKKIEHQLNHDLLNAASRIAAEAGL